MSAASRPLWDSIQHSIDSHGSRIAVADGLSEETSYAELGERIAAMAAALQEAGIRPGDRVGLCLPKSIDLLVAMLGVLRLGAAYVPVNPADPASRNRAILEACSATGVLTGPAPPPDFLDWTAAPQDIESCRLLRTGQATPQDAPDGLAYLLHTSGSSGQPKGVMMSQAAVMSFIDWSTTAFAPDHNDRISAFAPFHFAMSVFDIYLALCNGGRLVLVNDDVVRHPPSLAELISAAGITIWYSTPSALRLLLDHGLERHRYPALRLALFAGEPFPPGDLRRLRSIWSEPGMYNLYGSTETNVIAWQEIPRDIPADRVTPYPLGRACSHMRLRVMTAAGSEASPGESGEIQISGPALMEGYTGSADSARKSFVTDADGTTWHRTGDIAQPLPDGALQYIGREGRIVKRRGYRIALGEIEAVLFAHPDIKEAAVVSLPDDRTGARITAFYTTLDGGTLPLIALKQYCAGFMPATHTPDRFVLLEALPKTSTGKTSYRELPTA